MAWPSEPQSVPKTFEETALVHVMPVIVRVVHQPGLVEAHDDRALIPGPHIVRVVLDVQVLAHGAKPWRSTNGVSIVGTANITKEIDDLVPCHPFLYLQPGGFGDRAVHLGSMSQPRGPVRDEATVKSDEDSRTHGDNQPETPP